MVQIFSLKISHLNWMIKDWGSCQINLWALNFFFYMIDNFSFLYCVPPCLCGVSVQPWGPVLTCYLVRDRISLLLATVYSQANWLLSVQGLILLSQPPILPWEHQMAGNCHCTWICVFWGFWLGFSYMHGNHFVQSHYPAPRYLSFKWKYASQKVKVPSLPKFLRNTKHII